MMVKPYWVARLHPGTLLIGSSRIEVGFDPKSAAWPTAMQPVFNLGIPGSGPDSQSRILQHALATTQPKYVVFGVSFVDAHKPPTHGLFPTEAPVKKQARSQFEARLSVTQDGASNPGLVIARAKDLAATLLSLDALDDSILTVLFQRDGNRSRLTSLGFNTATGFHDLVRSDGTYNLFVDKDRIKITEIIQWATEPRLEMEPLAQAIELAEQRGSEVVLVIAPVKADELEIYRQAGVMKLYDHWRSDVAEIVAVASRSGQASLWDFSAITPYTAEPLPPPSDRKTELNWFWESNHFKSALGDVIISRIFGNGPADFGKLITPDTLPEEQAAQHVLLRQYEKTHPADVRRVAELYAAGLQQACQTNTEFCRPQHPAVPTDDRDFITVQQEVPQEAP